MADNLKTVLGKSMEECIPEFYDAIDKHKRDVVALLLNKGILEKIDGDKDELYKKLLLIRDKRVMDYLGKTVEKFPIEMLDTTGANEQDLEFISYVLSKYKNKFDISDETVAEIMFETACVCGNKDAAAYLIKKKRGLKKLPLIVSYAPELIELLDIVGNSLLTNDVVVEMYVNAAKAPDPEERVEKLWKYGLNPRVKNSDGKKALDIVYEEAKKTKYEKNKSGIIKRQNNNNAARALRKIMEKDVPKKKLKKGARLAIIIAAIVVVVCAAAFTISYFTIKAETEAALEAAEEEAAETEESYDEETEDADSADEELTDDSTVTEETDLTDDEVVDDSTVTEGTDLTDDETVDDSTVTEGTDLTENETVDDSTVTEETSLTNDETAVGEVSNTQDESVEEETTEIVNETTSEAVNE